MCFALHTAAGKGIGKGVRWTGFVCLSRLTLYFNFLFIICARPLAKTHDVCMVVHPDLEGEHYHGCGVSLLGKDEMWSRKCGV